MKTLLNNPWVVGALCIAAVVTVYLRLFDSKSDSYSSPPVPPPAVVAAPPPVPAQLRVNSGIVQAEEKRDGGVPIVGKWVDKIIRDPFKSKQGQNVRLPETMLPDGEQDEDFPEDQPLRLQAIFMNGSNRIAVINNAFVKVGDRLSRFRVSQIKSDGVWLKNSTEKHWLEFGRSRKQEQIS